MRSLRTLIFWAHLSTALSVAAIVLIMSATGVLLTYQRQLQTWADTRALDGAPPTAGAVPLAPEALLAGVQGVRDGTPAAIRWRNDPAAPVELVYGPAGSLFVNAYSGAVLGNGSARTRAFFRAVTDWHRWLAMNGAGRSRGRAITGAANLAFLFMALSGFYLWWPQNLTARGFRNGLLFRRGLSGKARDFNWHKVIGFWSLVPLTIVIISALVISYGWASDILYRIAGDDAPSASAAPPAAASLPPGPSAIRAASAETPGETAPLVERARALMPDWRIITMQLSPRDGAVVFSLDRGDGGQPQKRVQVTLAAATGAVLKWEPFSSASNAQKARGILRFAHTGEVLGIPGQTIAGIASAGAIVMVWTGAALALRRLLAWLGRRRRRTVLLPRRRGRARGTASARTAARRGCSSSVARDVPMIRLLRRFPCTGSHADHLLKLSAPHRAARAADARVGTGGA